MSKPTTKLEIIEAYAERFRFNHVTRFPSLGYNNFHLVHAACKKCNLNTIAEFFKVVEIDGSSPPLYNLVCPNCGHEGTVGYPLEGTQCHPEIKARMSEIKASEGRLYYGVSDPDGHFNAQCEEMFNKYLIDREAQ